MLHLYIFIKFKRLLKINASNNLEYRHFSAVMGCMESYKHGYNPCNICNPCCILEKVTYSYP